MPLIGDQTYNIDFYILESNDPKTIVLLDRSTYLDAPEQPTLKITLPGFTGSVNIPYTPNGINVLNSDSLNLTEPCDYDATAPLPDGVYQITMQICPFEQLFNKKCYLKVTQFYAEYGKILLNFDVTNNTYDQDKLKAEIIDMDILIQSARAEVTNNSIERGVKKYQAALKKLASIKRKINCE